VNTKRWGTPYLVWMAVFIIAPMVLVLYYAFTNAEGGFSLKSFAEFADPLYIGVLLRSLWLALICTVICLGLGYPAAYFLASKGFSKANIMLVLFLLPMWMNFVLRTYAWMVILEPNGILHKAMVAIGIANPPQMLNNTFAVVLGMVYNFLTFMILPIYTSLSKMDHSLVEAAQDLGARPGRVFRRVTLPLSMPGVISGITMVFMPAASTFAISSMLGGSMVSLVGDVIEAQFVTVHNWNFGSAISLVLLVFILLSMRMVNGAGEVGTPAKKRGGAKT